MKKLNYLILFSFIFLLIAGCNDFVTNDEFLNSNDETQLKSTKKHPVFFTGEFNVWTDVPATAIDGVINQTVFGNSNSPHLSHLGKSALQVEEVIYLSPGSGELPWNEIDPWQTVAVVTFKAANKDELIAEINYEIDPKNFPVLDAYGSGVISGGTGRFENASGTIIFSAKFNAAEMKGVQKYSAEITY